MIPVAPGQQFREPHLNRFGKRSLALVVRRVFVGTDGKDYAEVYSADTPSDRRTLSVAVLSDKRRFVDVTPEAS